MEQLDASSNERFTVYFYLNFQNKSFLECLEILCTSLKKDSTDVVIRNIWNDGIATPEVELEGTFTSLKNWYSEVIAQGPVSDDEWKDWLEDNL